MGRRLNVSTPTVINTELIPLSESFYVEADGQLEQWYYENDERYAPNRKVTPMTLTPRISAFDKDTNMTYTPSFYIVRWFKLDWDDTQSDYVETEITNQVDSTAADYVKVGNDLLVKKNVGYTHSVTIICRAQYIDPRDSGITYNVEDSVLLTTNRDATILSPELDVDCPSSQAFNPLVDNHLDNNGNLVYDSEFTMKATSDYSSLLANNISQYKVDPLGTEEIKPDNETSVVTCAPTMDIRYGEVEQSDQTFMHRQTSGGQVPYIAGNMAYINKIKGNTVAWSQIVTNGNFANGTNGWTIEAGVTCNISNGTATIISTRARNGIFQRADTIIGHKYYFAFTYTAEKDFLARGGGISETTIPAASNFTRYSELHTAETNASRAIFNTSEQTSNTYKIRDIVCYDLTLMFGAGNEPTTVEEFESWLATNVGLQSYYPYNEGELIPVKMSAIKSVGFNLWDEEWEIGSISQTTGQKIVDNSAIRTKNFIPVIEQTSYYIKKGSGYNIYLWQYDGNGNVVGDRGVFSQNASFRTREGVKYIMFNFQSSYGTTYNNDICINLSDETRNGTYEAHWENEQYLPITELKGKVNGQGESVVIFPNGMKRVGDVYDEIFVEDGVVKAIKRVGSVDLGSLTWDKTPTSTNKYRFEAIINNIKVVPISTIANLTCVKYDSITADEIWQGSVGIAANVSAKVLICDMSFDSQDSFKSAMNGVMLYYELDTPIEYIIDNMPRGQFEWYGVDGGTEVLAETLPWYKSGQHTDTLVVDAMYGEEIRVVLRSRFSAGSDRLYPNKVYRSIVWKIPDVDINAYSENGGAVRSNTVSMNFDTIVNVKGSTLSDAIKNDNLRFNWKLRKSNSSTETDFGWGQRRTIAAEDLRNTIGASSSLASTLVLPYGYLLGANEVVTDSSEVVTDDGEPVYDRPVF